LADTGSQIIGTVHDEIILEVSEKMAGEVAVILKKTMIQAGKAALSKVQIEVEVTVADNWRKSRQSKSRGISPERKFPFF
jgi:DNA polymerase I-like protein with 3'-5' exonuclease and polymerase domains